jgi:hypothetical protein
MVAGANTRHRGTRPSADARLHELHPFRPIGGEGAPIVRAGIERGGGVLHFRWVVGGAAERLRLPAATRPPARADRLWEHTCFEAFLAPADAAAYWEVNLSPAGDWNVYRFDRYREGMRAETRASALSARLERASCGTLTLHAALDLVPFDELNVPPLDVGLAAVLETGDGALSHWAARHAGERPDFHRRDTFVVRLDGAGRP